MRGMAALCGASGLVALLPLLPLLPLCACAPFRGPDPAEAEAGADGGPNLDAADPDAQPDLPEDEGGTVLVPLDTDAGVDAACPVSPKKAADATPSSATGIVCHQDGALLANDGVVAGLDHASGGTVATVGSGNTVTSCVSVDFGAGVLLNDATVRLASNPSACGVACTPVTGCGTYDRASIFFSAQPGSANWMFAGHADLKSTLQDFRFLIPQGAMAEYVIVCRNGGGAARDDVVVDAVTGHCR